MKEYKDIFDFIVKYTSAETKKVISDIHELCERINKECDEVETDIKIMTRNYMPKDIIGGLK